VLRIVSPAEQTADPVPAKPDKYAWISSAIGVGIKVTGFLGGTSLVILGGAKIFAAFGAATLSAPAVGIGVGFVVAGAAVYKLAGRVSKYFRGT